MGAETDIAWTDSTFNPWWGCTRVSPGCEHCYAEALDRRIGGEHWGTLNAGATRRAMSESYWRQPEKWNKRAEREGIRHKVFCASMADVFEDVASPVVVFGRARLWILIENTPWLDWLLLTKRPENFHKFLPTEMWPLPNVWLGVTAENQEMLDKRWPILRDTPAAVRFLSIEPQLEHVDLDLHLWRHLALHEIPGYMLNDGATDVVEALKVRPDWVIVGAESGAGARPFEVAWAESLRAQCSAAGVSFFGKQNADKRGRKLPLLVDGVEVKEFPR